MPRAEIVETIAEAVDASAIMPGRASAMRLKFVHLATKQYVCSPVFTIAPVDETLKLGFACLVCASMNFCS